MPTNDNGNKNIMKTSPGIIDQTFISEQRQLAMKAILAQWALAQECMEYEWAKQSCAGRAWC